jgi:phage protein U
MMMVLGMFVFSLPTLAYQELQRQTNWKYASNARVGRRDAHQFTGKGDDSITLSGWIAPELTGSVYSLDALRLMADTGKSWILIQGTGRIYGSYKIDSVDETRSVLDGSGDAGKVEFTVKLTRTDEGVLPMLGLGDISALKNMISLDKLTNTIADSARSTIASVAGGITDKIGAIATRIRGGL